MTVRADPSLSAVLQGVLEPQCRKHQVCIIKKNLYMSEEEREVRAPGIFDEG